MAMNPQPRSVSVSRFSARIMSTWGGSGGVLVPSSGVGALWRGGAPTPPSPPDLSVTVWVRKKRWKDRLDRCGAGFPVPLGKSEALPNSKSYPRSQMSKYGGWCVVPGWHRRPTPLCEASNRRYTAHTSVRHFHLYRNCPLCIKKLCLNCICSNLWVHFSSVERELQSTQGFLLRIPDGRNII